MSSATIQIRRDNFQADEICQITGALKAEGYCCELCEGLSGVEAALSSPQTQLLLIGVAGNEAPQLIELINSQSGSRDVPLMVYINQPDARGLQLACRPEIDDYLC